MKFRVTTLLLACIFASIAANAAPWKTCKTAGDPHFLSFSGHAFDYQGGGWFKMTDFRDLSVHGAFADCVNKATCVEEVALRVTNITEANTLPNPMDATCSITIKARQQLLQTMPALDPLVEWRTNPGIEFPMIGCSEHLTISFDNNRNVFVIKNEDDSYGFVITIGPMLLIVAVRDSYVHQTWGDGGGLCMCTKDHLVARNGPPVDAYASKLALVKSDIFEETNDYLQNPVQYIVQNSNYSLLQEQFEKLTKTVPYWANFTQETEDICKFFHADAEILEDCVFDGQWTCWNATGNVTDCIVQAVTPVIEAEEIAKKFRLPLVATISIGAIGLMCVGGAVFIMVTAYFAVYPEKLPFTYKRRKISKFYGDTDMSKPKEKLKKQSMLQDEDRTEDGDRPKIKVWMSEANNNELVKMARDQNTSADQSTSTSKAAHVPSLKVDDDDDQV